MALQAFSFLVALSLLLPAAPQARQAAATLPPLPTDAAIEGFLRTARVVSTRQIGKGITGSVRATMSDGRVTHDAQIQNVDVAKAEFRAKGILERNFRDSWRFNVATYRIDRLLGLHLVPVSVQRTWRGERSAFTWWVDDVMLDESERLKKALTAPDLPCWEREANLVRLLDQLIDNADRNLGNLLITGTWRIWAIDHTRAFRYSRQPRNVATLTGIDREVLKRLEALDLKTVKQAVDGHITEADIRNLLSRRDGIVAHFKKRGEIGLFDRGNPDAGCGG